MVPEGFTDGLRAGDGHLRGRRARASIIGALAIHEPTIAQPSGPVVEQNPAADFTVIRHKQDGDESSILVSVAAKKPAASTAITAATAVIRRMRSDLPFRLFVRCRWRCMNISQI